MDEDRFRARLEKRLSDLSRRSVRIGADLRRGHSRDSEDRAAERENDEVLEGLDRGGLRELDQIRAALARVDAGTFGTCEACGGPIADERLEAVPHAATCIACAG